MKKKERNTLKLCMKFISVMYWSTSQGKYFCKRFSCAYSFMNAWAIAWSFNLNWIKQTVIFCPKWINRWREMSFVAGKRKLNWKSVYAKVLLRIFDANSALFIYIYIERDAICNDEKEMLPICCASFVSLPFESFESIVLSVRMEVSLWFCAIFYVEHESLSLPQWAKGNVTEQKKHTRSLTNGILSLPQQWTLS